MSSNRDGIRARSSAGSLTSGSAGVLAGGTYQAICKIPSPPYESAQAPDPRSAEANCTPQAHPGRLGRIWPVQGVLRRARGFVHGVNPNRTAGLFIVDRPRVTVRASSGSSCKLGRSRGA